MGKIIWTNGCFDILHIGHIEMLKYAKSLGSKLVVGLDTDDLVSSNKGEERPINTLDDRIKMIKSIRYVDEVTYFNSEDQLRDRIKENKIDIIVVGKEYEGRVIGGELADVKLFDRIGDYSTTNIIKDINKK